MTVQYYERDPAEHGDGPAERFPRNHVRFSKLLSPIGWLDRAGRAVGARPLSIRRALLRGYERAEPLDSVLGSRDEVDRLRELAVLGGQLMDDNPHLSPVGHFLLTKMGSGFVENRARMLRFYHDNRKHIDDAGSIRAPIIITGLPRSGTTLLHRLLSEDPATRSPYTYEMEVPLPPGRAGEDPRRDPRIDKSGSNYAMLTRLAPGLAEKFSESHRWSATEMEESFLYMLAHNGFPAMNFAQAGLEFTERYLAHDDKRPVFRYERLFLTTLDAYRPAESHWTLKAPNYAPCFPLIFEEYPDARVVLTHRNPLVTIPSLCRLLESWCIAFDRDGTFDKHGFARIARRLGEACLTTPFEYRNAHSKHESQIFDCLYSDLFADPIGMVKKVYDHFDLELTGAAERRMRRYLEDNRQGKYGRHRYSLEEYGLDAEELYARHSGYMQRYGFDVPERIERPTELKAPSRSAG